MLIRDRLKILLIPAFLLLPLGLAFYTGFRSRMERADFVFVNQGEISSLDPALATGIPEGRILMALCEGLTSFHPEGLDPLPACAASWESSPDGRIYIFAHVGGDDAYGSVDQSIVMDTFRLDVR